MKKALEISDELKVLVSETVKLLGSAIEETYGKKVYVQVEDLRQRMKKIRSQRPDIVYETLEKDYSRLSLGSTELLHQIAKSYSLMMELINACEAAYRIYRLGEKKFNNSLAPHSLVFVFTSHPTEARSKNFLIIMDKIESLLVSALYEGIDTSRDQLFHLLKIALKLNLANNRRPEVEDEAEQIFHTVMADDILNEQVQLRKAGINVYFRTWVGGDKDGHPKVGPDTMLQSMGLSRKRLLEFIGQKLIAAQADWDLLKEEELSKEARSLRRSLMKLKNLENGDGKLVARLKQQISSLQKKALSKKISGPDMDAIDHLLKIYPALVLPLELREDSGLIHEALKDTDMNIARMLRLVKDISTGSESKWYVRGFIISMCQTPEDLLAAASLVKKMTGSLTIPVVPLFENEKGLKGAITILREAMKKYDFVNQHQKKWAGRFEVMLGYSDSSKENGVLPGRLLVEKALLELEKFLLKMRLTPVFFHGSGGSVSRGGGSIKEQIAWWPQSALNVYKVTIQGETVQRHFHNPLIMRSQAAKIVDEFANYEPRHKGELPALVKFAERIQEGYRTLVQNPEFQNMTAVATPYEFLTHLKIGSRPTKRSGKGKFTLRAIPWILCWTQSRLLLPVWWGAGSAWSELNDKEKKEIQKAFKTSPLFESYVKHLGFTLAKIEPGVWKFLLRHADLESNEIKSWDKTVDQELKLTRLFFKELLGHEDYTWFNPRLGESIYFRSSMIHPLNVIQKISLDRKDRNLLRETVTGIASGMLTTG